jgi:RNA polymerase sigma-70 factor (ECF subfamily)
VSRAVDGPVGPDELDHLARLFQEEQGRVVATLIRLVGDIDVAEEAVQEAFVVAMERWPTQGAPPNPGGWILTTARNKAIDRHRRESSRQDRYEQAHRLSDPAPEPEDLGPVPDDRLRLMFTCCHPALNQGAQVALTLKLLGGLETAAIAKAFLVEEATMYARITRAKKKISGARIPYRIPSDAELPDRLKPVLAAIYLIFNEGYVSAAPEAGGLDRPDLCREAIRLARVLVDLMPDEPEAHGLLALMLLIAARRPARVADDGSLVLLADQDRSRWDHDLAEEGRQILRGCLRRDQPGPYQLQAAVNAVHSEAATVADTDWRQLVQIYDQLLTVLPSPVVELNRAVAVAEVDGPQVALALVDRLDLDGYQHLHAARADLLVRLDRPAEAADAYGRALELATNAAERRFLEGRRREAQGRT